MLFIYYSFVKDHGVSAQLERAHANSTVNITEPGGPVKCPVSGSRQEAIVSLALARFVATLVHVITFKSMRELKAHSPAAVPWTAISSEA